MGTLAAGLPQPPQDEGQQPQPADSFAPKQGSKIGGIFSTLLGWKHKEDVQKRADRVAYLQSTIHEALNNPNSRLPREDLDRYVGELSKNLESSQAPNIGKVLKGHVEQVYHAREMAGKAQTMAQAQPQPQAPPVTSAAAPAPDPNAGGGLSYPSAAPPGLPTPPPLVPFANGAGNSAGPAPLQNEKPAMLAVAG